eukprot:TRINITY_DN11961_c0_g1_i2.p1 TRINITY_DN11961_c0_g1~~TRINITY_DN11961_c0_g1_i2.p1  ORF type:complete len:313 (-),score=49.98 TRINITY_DN11961_c0_g1_i2:227-1165(-)
MHNNHNLTNSQVFLRGFLGGVANAVTMCFTNPLDVLKIRFQTSGELQAASAISKRVPMWTAASSIFANEGILGLYKGLNISMIRELTFSSARIGLYEPIKGWMLAPGQQELGFAGKLGAGVISGAVAASLFTPTDVIKVRFQADRSGRGEPRRYRSIASAVRQIVHEEGIIRGLYKGVFTTILRASVLSSVQLSTYDQSKHWLMRQFPQWFRDNMGTHFCASFFAGFMTAAASNPVDVVRTRIMNESVVQAGGSGVALYRNPFASMAMIVQHEGVRGLYKGFVPSYIRLGSATVLFLVLYEQLRRACAIPGL